jgi:large subunit ribosomal protein L18
MSKKNGGKIQARTKRHKRIRKNIYGTSDRPRLNVFRSFKHIYAQVIDDSSDGTLVSASSLDKELRGKLRSGGNIAAAKLVGSLIATRAAHKGIKKVVFSCKRGRSRILKEILYAEEGITTIKPQRTFYKFKNENLCNLNFSVEVEWEELIQRV